MTLFYPIWLLLAIPIAALLCVWRLPTRLLLTLRVITLVLLLLAMGGLAVKLPSRAGTVVVVADRSLSMPPGSDALLKENIDLVQSPMASGDNLGVVSFGQTAAVERSPQGGKFSGFVSEVGRDGSNLSQAIQTALSLVPPDGPGRILVLSDGRWTGEDPLRAASRAASQGIGVDFRAIQRSSAGDLAISALDAPSEVSPGESFILTAWVRSPIPQEVTYELRRGGRLLSSGAVRLASGASRLAFRDRAIEPGTHQYILRVSGVPADPVLENNEARLLVGVRGPRSMLCLSGRDDSNLARLLESGGLKVATLPPEVSPWSLEELSNYSSVLIENVAAEKIGPGAMENIAAWVTESGSGLMLTGGKSAYAPGGYFRSPLDPILPVSMELRQEHRKLTLAIVVALDRSGSMMAPVGAGKTKMDLANLASAQVLDMLSAMDEFGVVAVDSAAHVITPLAKLTNKPAVRERILRIQSMGGGIFVYTALSTAAKMILPAKAGTRHIILFADAADSEEPGQYRELLEKCREANITVSVIGLGSPYDQDAEFLRDVARRGEGRCFFTDKPEELPRLFAQDTFVVARSTFLDEVTPIRPTAALLTLTGEGLPGQGFADPLPVGGYNLCYLRPKATLGVVTLDEYKAPVVASWHAGLGRVLCYTGEADGEYTGPIAKWDRVGPFFTSLARWVAGEAGELPSNMLLTQEVKEGACVLKLHLDPETDSPPFLEMSKVTVLRGLPGERPTAEKATLQWSAAHTLVAEVPLDGRETALCTVEMPDGSRASLPPVCLPYSPECRTEDAHRGRASLEQLAAATGGIERVNLPGIWNDLPRVSRTAEIAPWLLIAAVVVFLLEVLERRMGILSARRLSLWQKLFERLPRYKEITAKRPRRHVPKRAPAEPQPELRATPVAEQKASPESAAQHTDKEGMAQALHKARRRAVGRTKRDR